MRTKILYAIQYEDDPYCALYTKYIFDNKHDAFRFIKKEYEDIEPDEYTDLSCIKEFEYNYKTGKYEDNGEEWYYIKAPGRIHNHTDEFINGDTYWDEINEHRRKCR